MNKKRILIVSDYFYPHWTGISKSISYFLPMLTKNAQVTVLTVQHDQQSARRQIYSGATVIRTPFAFPISRSKYSWQQLVIAWQQIQKTDTVCINSPCANMLPLAIITKCFGKKLLIFHQGDLILPKNLFNMVLEKVFDLSLLLSCVLAEKIATYTNDYAKHSRILPLFLRKITAIIPPVPISKIKKVCSNEVLRNLVNKKRGRVYIGFAGRFVEEKGFDILLRAIPFLKKEIPNSVFLFAGEAHMWYEDFLKKNKEIFTIYQKLVIHVGLLDKACLQDFFEMLDVLVVPSRSDCFNLVQAEAMLAGTPVVVSNIPGARFLVEKTRFGKVFESENVLDLTEKIACCVRERNTLKKNAKLVVSILHNKKNEINVHNFFLL